ncbi:hypothetical protein [Flavobacterium sp. RS13.1]|uniref:hypothetical protein n=1 Tax=Flavobacterium sp. RS13.1 TaxID=3400345 RepID=UPI003AAF5669
MKKLVMLAVFLLGTAAMVNAQTTPAQATASKEVKAVKHDKKGHKKAKADKKAETDAAKPEVAKVQK